MDEVAIDPAEAASAQAFERRARARLRFDMPDDLCAMGPGIVGDGRTDGSPVFAGGLLRAAAVLVPVVAHGTGATVLLTERTGGLRDHAGQIAFPGGKIDPDDASPCAAALREAAEEIGLDPARITPLGYLDRYLTGTGFMVVPTVATVEPPFALTLNAREVADAFEVPLHFLMNPANHQRLARKVEGGRRRFYAMPFETRYIWGITAGILRNLYERLYG